MSTLVRRRWQMLVVFGLFAVTRLVGLAQYPHFYDSPEYVRLAARGPWEAIQQSHESIHPLYIWMTQVSYSWWPSVAGVSVVSVVMGLLSLGGLGYFVWRQWGYAAAVKALLLFTLLPALFLLQTHVMHEAVEQACLLWGVIGMLEYFRHKKLAWFGLSIGLLAAAVFNYVGIVVWLPLCLTVIWWCRDTWSRADILQVGAGFILAVLLGQCLLLGLGRWVGIDVHARYLFFQQQAGVLADLLTPIGFLRVVRNTGLVLLQGYGPVIGLVWVGAIFDRIWRRDWKSVTVLAAAAGCFVISMSFWHGGMYGRLGAVVGLFLAVLGGLISRRWLYGFVIFTTSISFLTVLIAYQQTPIPLQQKQLLDNAKLSSTDLVVLSDYQRPQLSYTNAVYVGSATYPQVQREIEAAVSAGQRVLITAQAVRFPYGQYDGQRLHVLHEGPEDKAHLYSFLNQFELRPVVTDSNRPLLTVYEVLPNSR